MAFDTRIPFRRAAADSIMPLGVHAGLWVENWSPASARFAIEGAALAGYQLIEIPVPDGEGSLSPDATARLLDEAGLDAVVSLALDPQSDINVDTAGSDPAPAATSARGELRLLQAVEFARAIGANYVGGVTYSAMTKYAHPATEASRANSLDVLTRVAAVARKADVRIGLEYVNRYESNLLNTAAQTAEFIAELGARDVDNVLLHIDTYHANGEEISLAGAVRDAGGLLGYLHLSESHRGRIGTGSLDWTGLFAALAEAEYRGPLTVETFSPAIVSSATRDQIGAWRSLWSDPVDVARESAIFLRALLAASAPLTTTDSDRHERRMSHS
ncbi:sugar phosphate isomerase/epimerase [Agreia sp. COWG]|uniref:sugar phosphate isomerase/epimerase family protein n=1 Tax=Agreia sp. COWG TaxID=2773266 RepID=UPI00192574FE|nr:sugar phosphate isomerase/epimerase [Agreia sp. COWG]CAD5990367.1 D-psicose/D-tagatose/L-ribulose 3-epimerase [Agreia sp. COWG]